MDYATPQLAAEASGCRVLFRTIAGRTDRRSCAVTCAWGRKLLRPFLELPSGSFELIAKAIPRAKTPACEGLESTKRKWLRYDTTAGAFYALRQNLQSTFREHE